MKRLPKYVDAPYIGPARVVGRRVLPSGEELLAIVPRHRSSWDVFYASWERLKKLTRAQYMQATYGH